MQALGCNAQQCTATWWKQGGNDSDWVEAAEYGKKVLWHQKGLSSTISIKWRTFSFGRGGEEREKKGERQSARARDLGNGFESGQGGPVWFLWCPDCIWVPWTKAEAVDSLGWYRILFIKTLRGRDAPPRLPRSLTATPFLKFLRPKALLFCRISLFSSHPVYPICQEILLTLLSKSIQSPTICPYSYPHWCKPHGFLFVDCSDSLLTGLLGFTLYPHLFAAQQPEWSV